jgi:hypothetical protein
MPEYTDTSEVWRSAREVRGETADLAMPCLIRMRLTWALEHEVGQPDPSRSWIIRFMVPPAEHVAIGSAEVVEIERYAMATTAFFSRWLTSYHDLTSATDTNLVFNTNEMISGFKEKEETCDSGWRKSTLL